MNFDYNHWEDLPEAEQEMYIEFLFGECEYFAYALRKEFGYDMVRAFGEDEDGNEMVVHVFCIDKNGDYIDIRGVTNSCKEFFEPYEDFLDSSDPIIVRYNPAQYIIDEYEGLHENSFAPQSVKTALAYIKQNYKKFSGEKQQKNFNEKGLEL